MFTNWPDQYRIVSSFFRGVAIVIILSASLALGLTSYSQRCLVRQILTVHDKEMQNMAIVDHLSSKSDEGNPSLLGG